MTPILSHTQEQRPGHHACACASHSQRPDQTGLTTTKPHHPRPGEGQTGNPLVIAGKSVNEFMSQDHDRLDAIFESFKKSIATMPTDPATTRTHLHAFKTGLQRHIAWEEEVLFPIFEDKTGMKDQGPTAMMREEHRQIKGFLTQIHDAFHLIDTKMMETAAAGVFAVLSQHNVKEESILYPWIDDAIGDGGLSEVFKKMKDLPSESYSKCCPD